MIAKVRVFSRGFLAIFAITGFVFFVAIRSLIYGYQADWSLRVRRRFLKRLLQLIGVKIDKQGTPPQGTFLFVGNHRSYLDPIVQLLDIEAFPVAKAEVANWPLIGYGAKITGIMYVKRESGSSRKRTLDSMKHTLHEGHSVLIFPEGTTSMPPTLLPFKKGAFYLAAKEKFPIVPIVIEYEDEKMAWVGDDTFIPHFLRCFGAAQIKVKLIYGEPILSKDVNLLLESTHDWMKQQIDEIWKKESEELVKTKKL